MEIFMKAAINKTRVKTASGLLSVELLADLSMTSLKGLAIEMAKSLETKDVTGLEFLDESPIKVDSTKQLHFDIVKALYTYKRDLLDSTKSEQTRKRDLASLLEIKARRVADSKEKMSDDDLDKQIAALTR